MQYADFDDLAQARDWHRLQRMAESALAKDPKNTDAFIFLALATQRIGFSESAQRILHHGVGVVEGKSRLLNYSCHLLSEANRWDVALFRARENIRKYPTDLWCYHVGIEAARHLFRFSECVSLIDEAVAQLGPTNVGSFMEYRATFQAKSEEAFAANRFSSYSSGVLVDLARSVPIGDGDEFERELWSRFNSLKICPNLFAAMAIFYTYSRNLMGYVSFAHRHLWLLNENCEASALEYARDTFRFGDFETTRNICERVLASNPTQKEASLLLIRSHSAAGFQGAQQSEIERAIVAHRTDPDFSGVLRMRYGAMESAHPKNAAMLGGALDEVAVPTRRPRHASTRPRVAVCIGGQLRGFRQTFPSLVPLVQELDADVFVHAWDDIGTFSGPAAKAQALARLPVLLEHRERLSQDPSWAETAFPRTIAALDAPTATTADALEFYGARKAVIESGADFAASMQHEWIKNWGIPPNVNQCKLLYKVWACHQMAQDAEDYDIFIRIRPDLRMLNVCSRDVLRVGMSRSIVAGSYMLAPEYHGFSDQFAIGSSFAMSAYSNIWPHVLRTGSGRYAPNFPDLLREEIFFFQLFASGIDMTVSLSNVADILCREPDVFESGIRQELEADLLELERAAS